MDRKNHLIDWNYSGKTDFLLGTGANVWEKILGWMAGLVGILLYVYFYLYQKLPWTWWQYLIAGFIAFDILGGVVANSLNSCKRFYHTPAKEEEPLYTSFVKNHFFFALLHIHPLLITWLYPQGNLLQGAFWYLFLLLSTFIIIKIPLYLQRPTSFLFISFALLINLYFLPPIHGFEWFIPALFIKILYGHIVPEEPYRPTP